MAFSCLARLLGFGLVFGASAATFAQPTALPEASGSLDRKTITIIPAAAHFYLGRPNLRLMREDLRSGEPGRSMQRLYDDPALFERRLDEESTRIARDLDRITAEAFEARGCRATLAEPPAVPEETVRHLQAQFWSAVSPLPADAGTFAGAALARRVAGTTSADALLVTRFWGWRRGALALPAMGYTKSAAHVWIGLISGESGALAWVGEGEAASLLLVSKYETQNLDKIVAKALKTLGPEQPCRAGAR